MQLRLLALLCLALLSYSVSAQKYLDMIEDGTYTITEIQQEAEAHFNIVGRERGSGYKQYKRWEYVALMELDGAGIKIPNTELARRARDYRKASKDQGAEFNGFGGSWKQLGPTYWNATSSWNPGVGRVTSIGIDQSNSKHLIVGSPTGGVWKTLDGGGTWAQLTDDFSTVDVYALEISPYDNKRYLWGSTLGRIYRSNDGGATWNTTGNVSGSGRVSRIQFHPTDPNIVYAVSESNGLYRSVNSGATWSAVSGVSGVTGYDVEFKPGDPNTIYFSGLSVFRSTDGGVSFTKINGFSAETDSRKRMGVSPANPNFVYVVESDGSKFGGFYKSTDSGASFTQLISGTQINFFGYSATGEDDRGQAPRNMDIAVSLSQANEVHIGGIHTWKSTNGGVSFELTSHWVPSTAASLGVGYNHADINILKFAKDTLFVGTDGGIYRSTDGASTFVDRTSGLGIREFYKIGVSKTNPNVVSGGAQDNGTSVMRGNNRAWVDWLGADGMETFVDWNNANTLYGTSQNGSMYRSTDQGNTRTSISKPPDVGDGAWVTPFEQDPLVAATIYVAFADVWKSTNSGTSWVKISDFNNGNMSQMKIAPSTSQRIYVSRGSSLFTTANGGGVWKTITSAWGTSTISYIAVHPQTPERVLVVTSSAVYQSMNAGDTWTTISAGLPSGTKYCAVWENTGKNGIYVGGFGFVSYINDNLSTWVSFFDGLPNARVYELEINYISKTIFAGTYGRGLWESPLYQLLTPVAAFRADQRQGCKEMTVKFTDESANYPDKWEWTFEGGTPATSNLQHPTVTFSGSGTYTVRLKSSNGAGENTVEQVDYITIHAPVAPAVSNIERCGPGEVSIPATSSPGSQVRWFDAAAATNPLFIGDVFTTTVSETDTFYAAASTTYLSTGRVGPKANTIGSGGDHGGAQYLILDATKPFRLKSAVVYAVGAKDRIFQVRDANGVVLVQKTIFVNDGESRVVLDLDVPQASNLQIGVGSSANLYRNDSGVTYPYTLNGLVQIKNSTAGLIYYYYLYDMEVESSEVCESDRVAVPVTVRTAPEAPAVTASGETALCPGASVVLTATNVCAGCTVNWSNGTTGPSITVSETGTYTAIVQDEVNNTCGNSLISNAIAVTTLAAPTVPTVSASGSTTLCAGETVVLTADNVCPDCTVKWSNGETGASITVAAAGAYTATLGNTCGNSLISNAISVTTSTAPAVPTVSASGSTALCAGETVVLTASNVCPDCTVNWSNGQTGTSITVAVAGDYTATFSNVCGESPASNAVLVTVETIPATPTIITSGPTSLCLSETVVLTAGNVCLGCTVNWSNGETAPSITVVVAGAYTATFSNICGESPTSDAVSVTTGTAPAAAILSAAGSTILCAGESVVLTASNVCPDCIVNWSNGETGASITVAAAGAYTATLGNTCGNSLISNAISVTTGTVPAAPTVSASGSTALCAGETVVLTAGNVCPGCIVNWSNGETGPSITVAAAGAYTATLGNTCGNSLISNAISVTTSAAPAAPTVAATGSTALCAGETVVLTATNICPDCTVNWSNGETGPSITVAAAGAYTATLGNTCGNSLISNAISITTTAPAAPTVAAAGSTALCAGETVVLTASNICPNCTVNWSNGETGASITVAAAGAYTATLGNICGNSLGSNSVVVTNYPLFVPMVQVSNLCVLNAPVGADYQWFVGGVSIPGATGPSWSAQVAGTYTVSMSSPTGCPGISEPVPAEACVSGTRHVEGIVSVRVYPNPVQDRFFLDIQVLQAMSAHLDLYAADGRYVGRLFQGDVLPGGPILDIQLPDLPSGVYQYRLVTEMGSVNGDLVVERH